MRWVIGVLLLAAPALAGVCDLDQISPIHEGSTGTATLVFCGGNNLPAGPDTLDYEVRSADTLALLLGPVHVDNPGPTWSFQLPVDVNSVEHRGGVVYRVVNATIVNGGFVTTHEWQYPLLVGKNRPIPPP